MFTYLLKVFIYLHIYNTGLFPLLSSDRLSILKIQKLAIKFLALHFSSEGRRRIRGDFMCMYKIEPSHLNFLWEPIVAPPPAVESAIIHLGLTDSSEAPDLTNKFLALL